MRSPCWTGFKGSLAPGPCCPALTLFSGLVGSRGRLPLLHQRLEQPGLVARAYRQVRTPTCSA